MFVRTHRQSKTCRIIALPLRSGGRFGTTGGHMDVLWLSLIVLAIVGHLLITRASLGFGYTLGLRRNQWHVLVIAHVVVGIVVSALIARFAPARIGYVPWPWLAYMSVCIAAVPVGIVVIEWRRRRAIPALQLSNHTSTHDAVKALGHVPAPMNLTGRIARLRGNEMFHVDLTTRTIVLPRLPRELDGFSILHLTDLHFHGVPDRKYFEWACELCAKEQPADMIALTGDIVDREELIDWLLDTLGRLGASARLGAYFILGNHDLDCDPTKIKTAMAQIGWTWLGARCITIEDRGQRIALAGNEVPWAGKRPVCDDVARSAALKVMLSHAPHEVRWAQGENFDLALAGHLHGGQIRFPLAGPIIGGRFASGIFDLPPTVLHVSRGLGALTPLRFGCRPEAVKLVLKMRQ
jgi:predicted MPP superfamily phosphohydrolase